MSLSMLYSRFLSYHIRNTSKIVTYCTFSGKNETSDIDPTQAKMSIRNKLCSTPKEARTNLLRFLTESDIQKRRTQINIPFFTAGSCITVTYADSSSPIGQNKFTGICIARSNKGLGSTFILRNVIQSTSVERMFELYSPHIINIKVLKLERRRRAKLYYLRDKPLKYSTVKENMEASDNKKLLVHRRRGQPA